MLNLDPGKLLIIALVAIIVLGPDKLPQLARQAGAAWRKLNEFRHRMEAEVRGSIPDLPSTSEIAHFARSPSALLNRFAAMGDEDAAADGGVQGDEALASPAANGALSGNGNGTGPAHDDLPDGAPISSPRHARRSTGLDAPAGDPSLN